MKADIHPKYEAVTATCSCGNKIETRSTLCEDLHLTCVHSATRSLPASRRSWTAVVA